MKRRRRKGRWVRRFIVCATLLVSFFTAWQYITWPDVAALADHNPESTAFIEYYTGDRRPTSAQWRWVPYAAISANLKRAVLVAEDINFFSHTGFETNELGLAVRDAISNRRLPRGASTISQQVAKNLWLSPSRNPWRKLKEAVLTTQLEDNLTKRRILAIYLNIAQMGPDVFGAEAAAGVYFGTKAAELTEHQSAQLAATLSRPSTWNPSHSTAGYEKRVEMIKRRARRAGWLDKEL